MNSNTPKLLPYDVVILGPQGSGKGTQARLLQDITGAAYCEMGAMLRAEIASGSALGAQLQEIMDAGNLVSDAQIADVFTSYMAGITPETRVIFDGVQRTLGQKELFDRVMAERGRDFRVLFFDLPEEISIARILGRAAQAAAAGEPVREDDKTREAIAQRLRSYHEKTYPVIEAYEREGRLITIDARPSIDAVDAAVCAVLGL